MSAPVPACSGGPDSWRASHPSSWGGTSRDAGYFYRFWTRLRRGKESRMKPRAQGVGYGMGVGWLLVLLGVQPAAAAPCHVPSSNYPTIQAAVNDATCDAINVAAGTFTEHVTIDRDVTMRGEGEDRTIVDGSSSGTVVTITSGTVTIKGVTIQN